MWYVIDWNVCCKVFIILKEISTTMDPAPSCWSTVFQWCSGENPSYLEMALSFYSVPSWSFYLVSKVTAHSQFLTMYVLISDWPRTLSLDRKAPQYHAPSIYHTGIFLLPKHSGLVRKQPVQERCTSHKGRSALLGWKLCKQCLKQSINADFPSRTAHLWSFVNVQKDCIEIKTEMKPLNALGKTEFILFDPLFSAKVFKIYFDSNTSETLNVKWTAMLCLVVLKYSQRNDRMNWDLFW